MDCETVSAEVFGRSLSGLGVNILSREVPALAGFLADVFGLSVQSLGRDFAIVRHGASVFQLHGDGAYGSHPLAGLLPETTPRGAGVRVYLFGIDPDAAALRAAAAGHVVLEPARDKPHGLRECTILSQDGHAFSPAVSTA